MKKFAFDELKKKGYFNKEEPYNYMVGKAVMQLIETFDSQGHSGLSAEIVLSLFNKLVKGKPLENK